MAESQHLPDLVLVYESQAHKAMWLLPSVAWLFIKANLRAEIIEETHPHFDAYSQLAGTHPYAILKEPVRVPKTPRDDSAAESPPEDSEGDQVRPDK